MRKWSRRLLRDGAWMTGAALIVIGAMHALDRAARSEAALQSDAAARAQFEAVSGVRLVRVSVTAGGGMVDLRYQALDPDKAQVVHDQDNPPKVIDEASGAVVSRPWMDHAHDRPLHTAVTYYQLLMNPGGVIRRGNQVSVTIGDARLEHLTVQ